MFSHLQHLQAVAVQAQDLPFWHCPGFLGRLRRLRLTVDARAFGLPFPHLPQLEDLHLTFPRTYRWYSHILDAAHTPRLRVCFFVAPPGGCYCLGGATIIRGSPPSLEHLSLSNINVEHGWEELLLATAPTLRSLYLGECQDWTDDVVQAVRFPRLTYLSVLKQKGHAFNFIQPTSDTHIVHVGPGTATKSSENLAKAGFVLAAQA